MMVSWACGHRGDVPEAIQSSPVCPDCGDPRIRDVKAPAPRFVGVARGPSVTSKVLEAIALDLAPRGPLKLKEEG